MQIIPHRPFKPYLQLVRPANIITAWADIFAGIAISEALYPGMRSTLHSTGWLLLTTSGLYAGGITLNDWCDRRIDAIERPERPIPRGEVPANQALILGVFFFGVALFSAARQSFTSFLIASGLVIMCGLYDGKLKRYSLWGPIAMGSCRSLNLLLGMSLMLPPPQEIVKFLVIPFLLIIAITRISQQETTGGRQSLLLGLIFYGIVAIGLLFIGVRVDALNLPLWAMTSSWFYFVSKPLFIAHKNPSPFNLQQSVKAGVLSLFLLDTALVLTVGKWTTALVILSLFPFSRWLAKYFSVT